jgi:hypothetical protein
MNENEQHDLLIRLDEKTDALCRWTTGHDELHKEQRSVVRRVIYPVYAAIIGIIVKLVFWN